MVRWIDPRRDIGRTTACARERAQEAGGPVGTEFKLSIRLELPVPVLIVAAAPCHKPIVFVLLRRKATTISFPDTNFLFVLPVDGDSCGTARFDMGDAD